MVKDRAKKCHTRKEFRLSRLRGWRKITSKGVERRSHFPIHRQIISHKNLGKVLREIIFPPFLVDTNHLTLNALRFVSIVAIHFSRFKAASRIRFFQIYENHVTTFSPETTTTAATVTEQPTCLWREFFFSLWIYG